MCVRSSPVFPLREVAGMVQGFAHGFIQPPPPPLSPPPPPKKTNNFNGPHGNSARCHICIDFALMALQLEELSGKLLFITPG